MELLAANHEECDYAWAIPVGLQLRAEALLLQAAQMLGAYDRPPKPSYQTDKRDAYPAHVAPLIEQAKKLLHKALNRWNDLRDPEPTEDNNFKLDGKEYIYRTAETHHVLVQLEVGNLTHYPLHQAAPERGGSQLPAQDFQASGKPCESLLAELRRSMQSGDLRNSRLAPVVLESCQLLANMQLSADYDLESLAAAIQDADELIRNADELAGKLLAREFAFKAVRRIVMSLVHSTASSRRLQTVVVRLAEEILALDEIAITVRWPRDGKDNFYNAALWGQEADIDRLLEEYTVD